MFQNRMNYKLSSRNHIGRLGWIVVVTLTCAFTNSTFAQRTHLDEEYTLAAGYYARGQWQQAENAFSTLIKSYPDTEQAIAAEFFLPESLMQQGEFDRAFQSFQAFLKRHPKHTYTPRATFRMGESAFRLNKHEISLRLLEEFVKQNPNHELNEFALTYLGQLRNFREEPQLAQLAFETSLRLYPKGSLANLSRLGLAKALQNQATTPGNMDEAQRFYEFLITDFDPEIAAEARIQLGVIELDRLNLPKASRYFHDAIKQSDTTEIRGRAGYWLARMELEQENYADAFDLLKPLTELDLDQPIQTSIWFDGAVAAAKTDHLAVAIAWLQLIRKTYPNSRRTLLAVNFEIDLLRQIGQYDQAMKLAKTYQIKDQIDSVEQTATIANVRKLYESGELEQVIQVVDQFEPDRNRSTESGQLLYFKALSKIGQRKWQEAESTLKSIQLENCDDELRSLVTLALASSQYSLERYQSAIRNYEAYLNFETGDRPRALLELAICHAKLLQFERANQSLERLTSNSLPSGPSFEIGIEQIANLAYKNQSDDVGLTWMRFLSENATDSARKSRCQTRIAMESINLDSPNENTFAAFQKLFEQMGDLPNETISKSAIAAAHRAERNNLELSVKIYDLIAANCSDSKLANIARQRVARNLLKSNQPDRQTRAKKVLTDYLKVDDVTAKPAIDEVLYQLAWLEADLGNPGRSNSYFRRLNEECIESKYWSDATYRLMQQSQQRNDDNQTRQLIDEIRKRHELKEDIPEQVLTRTQFALAQLHVKKRNWSGLAQTIQEMDMAKMSPALQAQAMYWRAESAFQLGQFENAVEDFESLRTNTDLSKHRQQWAMLRIAQISAKLNRWEKVEQICRDTGRYQDFANVAEFDFLYARYLERKGLLNDARMKLLEVISAPTSAGTELAAQAQWRIGELFFHQERYTDAINAYYKVDSLYDFPKWRCAALIQAGKCQEQLGHPNRAIKLYEQLIRTFPESKYIREAKSRAQSIQRDLRTAGTTNQKPVGR